MINKIDNINNALVKFKIKATCVNYSSLYKCNCYDLRLEPATTIKHIEKYAKELSLFLKEESIPKISLLLEEGYLRLEFAKFNKENINLSDLINVSLSDKKYQAPIILGKSMYGESVCLDLLDSPHLLISGCTGSGKSVALHNIIANLLWNTNAELFLVDPKMIEFSKYENVKNINVVYGYQESLNTINNLLSIMEIRFNLIKSGCNTNHLAPIVLVIDEFADLSLQDKSKEFYNSLCKLAQKCRAAKMSIVLATQRPSSKLLDGNIKANFPARLACKTASAIDSKIILDEKGAEELMGKGDAILKCYKYDKIRLQIAYVNSHQILNGTNHGS